MYKTFKDIEFKPHPVGDGVHGKIFFPNGYGLSVVRFKIGDRYSSYTNNGDEWEVGIIKGTSKKWELCYDTDITNDVLGHQTEEDINNIIKHIIRFPSENN